MKDILEDIVAWKRKEVERQRTECPSRELYSLVERKMQEETPRRSMSESLKTSPYGIIAEFKRKSPSKGWIHEEASPEAVVGEYARNGASALSILTDEHFFGGDMDFIKKVRPGVNLPVLRKDFIIDEYQLFQTKAIGADAVLLIAADLRIPEYTALLKTAHELGLEVLLEIHEENELDYVDSDADMVGVNNRDLGTFHTNVENSFRLSSQLPADKVLVSESGITNPETIRLLRHAGFRGFLMGEHFMKAIHPGLALREFIEELK